MSMVYVVTMVGIFDQGCGGVFSTRQAAEAHARSQYETSDGYHGFRVDEMPLDHPIDLSRRRSPYTDGRPSSWSPDNPPLKFVPFDPGVAGD